MRAHFERADGKAAVFIQAHRVVALGTKHAIRLNVGHEAIKVGASLGCIGNVARQCKAKGSFLVVHEQLDFAGQRTK